MPALDANILLMIQKLDWVMRNHAKGVHLIVREQSAPSDIANMTHF